MAHYVSSQHMVLTLRIAARFEREAFDFPTPEALKKYLQKHPKADPSKHHVQKPEKPERPEKEEKAEKGAKGDKAKSKSFKDHYNALSQGAKKFVQSASAEIKKFITDDAHRRGVLMDIHKSMMDLPEATFNKAKKAIKHEAHEIKLASEGIKTALKGGKMTKEQKKAIRTVATHVALTVAVTAVSGGLGGGAAAFAGKASATFLSTLCKKVAFKSVTEGLGHVPTVQEVGHLGHGVAELLQHVVTADEKGKKGKATEDDLIVAYVTALVAEQIKNMDPEDLAEAIEAAAKEESE